MNRNELLTVANDKLSTLSERDIQFIINLLEDWEAWMTTFETMADPEAMAQLNDPDTTTIPAELVNEFIFSNEKDLKDLLVDGSLK